MQPSFISKRPLETIAVIAMVLAWLIPNHYPPWVSFYNESAMVIAAGVLMLAVFARRIWTQVPLVAWVMVLVGVTPWLQWLSGILAFSGDAVVASAYIFGCAGCVFVGHALTRRDGPLLAELLSLAALFACVISSVIAITQAFDLMTWQIWGEFASPNMRAVGNLAQPNNFALLLGFGILGAWYLYERGHVKGWVGACLVFMLVVAAALTQSRMSLLFGPVALLATWLAQRRGVELKIPIAAVAAFAVAHWVLIATLPGLTTLMFGEVAVDAFSRGLSTPRYQMWRMLLDSLSLAPWTGYGWLQVGKAELAVVDAYPPVQELWLQGHNIFVELLVSCGWPLGTLLCGTLLYWFFSRVWRVATKEAAFGMLVIGFFGIHSLVEFPYHYAYFLFPVALWAGLVEGEQNAKVVGAGRWMLVPVGCAMAICIGIWSQYSALEEDYRLIRFETARIRLDQPSQPAPDAPMLSSLTSFLRFARTTPAAGMSPAELARMEVAVQRYPYAASLVRYAKALALNGRPEEARRAFVKIRYLFGDGLYRALKADLHQHVGWGETGLAVLDRSLPEPSELRP